MLQNNLACLLMEIRDKSDEADAGADAEAEGASWEPPLTKAVLSSPLADACSADDDDLRLLFPPSEAADGKDEASD